MIEWLSERLISLIPTLAALQAQKQQLADDALGALSRALNETYLYHQSAQNDRKRDLATEAQLSRIWAAAAVPLRHIDSELARTCEFKSEYWIDPDKWSRDKVANFGIGLDRVRQQYRAKLGVLRTPGG